MDENIYVIPTVDPKGLIGQVVAMGSEFPGPAEDLLLSWILSLPPETDAPKAAAALLIHHERQATEWPEGSQIARLFRLLRETASAVSGRSRRQGGAGGRRR